MPISLNFRYQSEYRSNFQPPSSFQYTKGAWVRAGPPHLHMQENQKVSDVDILALVRSSLKMWRWKLWVSETRSNIQTLLLCVLVPVSIAVTVKTHFKSNLNSCQIEYLHAKQMQIDLECSGFDYHLGHI